MNRRGASRSAKRMAQSLTVGSGDPQRARLMDSPQGYGIASKVMHWVGGLAALLLFGIGTAVWVTNGSADSSLHHRLSALHIALGGVFTIPLLMRVLWRLMSLWSGRQPSPISSQAWMRRIEQVVQLGLVVMLTLLVLSGPLLRWWSGNPIELFGGWYIPNPFDDNQLFRTYARAIHQRSWQVMAVLLVLHVGGAVLHRRLSWERMRWFKARD